jgi:hypothetical protein
VRADGLVKISGSCHDEDCKTANAADFSSLSKQSLTLLPFVTVSFVNGAQAYRSRRTMLLLRCTSPEVARG